MKIKELKELNKVSTSEELFDIVPPPEYQCPNINHIIDSLQKIEKESFVRFTDEYDDLVSKLDEISYHVGGLVDELECIRKAIENVRQQPND